MKQSEKDYICKELDKFGYFAYSGEGIAHNLLFSELDDRTLNKVKQLNCAFGLANQLSHELVVLIRKDKTK